MSERDRRESKRVTFYCEARLDGMDVAYANVRLSDLSVDGAFVDARTVLPEGAVTGIHFRILSTDVSLNAEVRYSMPGMGMGLRFLNPSPEVRQTIERFLLTQG